MKIFATIVLVLSTAAQAQVWVQPHVNKNGVYIEGYQRTAPNDTLFDNYSTRGNVNPYTGTPGTIDPYATPSPRSTYSNPVAPSHGYRRAPAY